MKVKETHFSQVSAKIAAMNEDEIQDTLNRFLISQPQIGGQLAALSQTEGIPDILIGQAARIVVAVLYAVELAGGKLPQLTQYMFQQEQAEMAQYYSRLEADADGVFDTFLDRFEETMILTYLLEECKKQQFEKRHATGKLLVAVLHSIVNVISKNVW